MSILTVRLVRSILGVLFAFFLTAHLTFAADASVPVGKTVTLSVVADGSAPFFYQWNKDGSPIRGATSPTYSIASFSALLAGNYSVVVANSAGSTTSDIASISVNLGGSLPPPDTSSGFFDSSFESINVGTDSYFAFAYGPVGSAWSFTGGSNPTHRSTPSTGSTPENCVRRRRR